MLISLEGIDGVGKTSICNALSQMDTLAPSVTVISKRRYYGSSTYVRSAASKLHEVLWALGDTTDLPVDFWIHLQLSWYNLIAKDIEYFKYSNELYILDGWFYKFVGRLAGSDKKYQAAFACFDSLPQPDLVLLLQCDPATVYDRREFSDTEKGLHDDKQHQLSLSSFVDYQMRTFEYLHSQFQRFDHWRLVDLNDLDLDASVKKVAGEITVAARARR